MARKCSLTCGIIVPPRSRRSKEAVRAVAALEKSNEFTKSIKLKPLNSCGSGYDSDLENYHAWVFNRFMLRKLLEDEGFFSDNNDDNSQHGKDYVRHPSPQRCSFSDRPLSPISPPTNVPQPTGLPCIYYLAIFFLYIWMAYLRLRHGEFCGRIPIFLTVQSIVAGVFLTDLMLRMLLSLYRHVHGIVLKTANLSTAVPIILIGVC